MCGGSFRQIQIDGSVILSRIIKDHGSVDVYFSVQHSSAVKIQCPAVDRNVVYAGSGRGLNHSAVDSNIDRFSTAKHKQSSICRNSGIFRFAHVIDIHLPGSYGRIQRGCIFVHIKGSAIDLRPVRCTGEIDIIEYNHFRITVISFHAISCCFKKNNTLTIDDGIIDGSTVNLYNTIGIYLRSCCNVTPLHDQFAPVQNGLFDRGLRPKVYGSFIVFIICTSLCNGFQTATSIDNGIFYISSIYGHNTAVFNSGITEKYFS